MLQFALFAASESVNKTEPVSTWGEFWKAAPSLAWPVLVGLFLLGFQKELSSLLSNLVYRIKSGGLLKFGSVEIGAAIAVRGPNVTDEEQRRGVVADNGSRAKERHSYYENAGRAMLVHTISRSRKEGQLFDILIYLIPHKGTSLLSIARVEYFFGKYWGNKVFPSDERCFGFPIKTSAYGPFLCTAKVFFVGKDQPFILHRYIDFEMGAYAPLVDEDDEDKDKAAATSP